MDIVSAMRFFSLMNEADSLAAASERLGVAPSSVSRKLSALETELGVKLMHRTTRSIRLTEAGARFLQRSRVLLSDLDEIQNELKGQRDNPKGKLKMNVPVSLAEYYIAPVLKHFYSLYPDIEIELVGDDKIIDLLRSDVDIAIRVGQLKDSHLISRRLGPLKYCLCASPSYLQANGKPTTIAELQGHNCLSFQHPIFPRAWAITKPSGEVQEVKVEGSLSCNNEAVLLQAVRSGLGVSLLIDWYAEESISKGEVVPIMEDHEFTLSFMQGAEIFLVYAEREYQPEKVRCFIDFLVNEKRMDKLV